MHQPLYLQKSGVVMKSIVLSFVFFSSVFAQIDTTIWYPLQQGNYWEYYDASVQKGVTVLGDTTIDGKVYSILQTIDFSEPNNKTISYRRLESNKFLYQLRNNKEVIYYDFSIDERSSWEIDSSYYSRTFVKTDTVWSEIFQTNLTRKEYEDFYTAGTIEREWQQVSKGIGETLLGYSGGYIELVGAIINGVKYGSVTSVEKTTSTSKFFNLNQNYPNPFNPSTMISYSIPENSFVSLNVFNSLGQVVSTLVSEHQPAGSYNIDFNSENLSSGIYFYRIQTNDFTKTIKMVLLR